MLKTSEKSIHQYFRDTASPDHLSRSIKYLESLSEAKTKSLYQKYIEPILIHLGFIKIDHAFSNSFINFLDTLIRTDLSNCPLNKNLRSLKEQAQEIKDLFNRDHPQNIDQRKLEQIQKSLLSIALQVEANRLVSRGHFEEFQKLKKDNPDTIFYLKNIVLNKKNIKKLDLSKCIVEELSITDSKIDSFIANNTSFEKTNFEKVKLGNLQFNLCNFDSAVFKDCAAEKIAITNSVIKKSEIDNLRYEDGLFEDLAIFNSSIQQIGCPSTNLSTNTRIKNISLKGSSLSNNDFSTSEIENCDIEDSTLKDIVFTTSLIHGMNINSSKCENVEFHFGEPNVHEIFIDQSSKSGLEFLNCFINFDQAKILYKANDLLSAGKVKEFNKLRSQHQNIHFYLKNINLKDKDLSDLDLSNSTLSNSRFSNCQLSNLKTSGSTFNEIIIEKSKLSGSISDCIFNKSQFLKSKAANALSKEKSLSFNNIKFNGCNFANNNWTNTGFSNAEFTNSRLDSETFHTEFLNKVCFRNTVFDNCVSQFGEPQEAQLEFENCTNQDQLKFEKTNKRYEQIVIEEQLKKLLQSKTGNEKKDFLFQNAELLSFIDKDEVLSIVGISRDILKRFDPELANKDNEDQISTFIHKLHIIEKIRLISKSICPSSHQLKLQAKIEALLYDSIKSLEGSKSEIASKIAKESKHLLEFNKADCEEVKDSIDEIVDYLLIPRIAFILKDYASLNDKFNASILDKITRFLQPTLLFFILHDRNFDRLPKSSSFLAPSLVLNFSRDVHERENNFTGSIREFAPQGSWSALLRAEDPTHLIQSPNGKSYKVVNLLNSASFKEESDCFGHCIGQGMTYVNRAKSQRYHYFSIREADTGERISTLELEIRQTKSRDSSLITGTNLYLDTVQNQGYVSNGRSPAIGAEIAKIFAEKIRSGEIKINIPSFDSNAKVTKSNISAFENHIGCKIEADATSGKTGTQKALTKAWARLAQPGKVFLDRNFGKSLTEQSVSNGNQLNMHLALIQKEQNLLALMRARPKQFDENDINQQSQKVIKLREEIELLIEDLSKPKSISHDQIDTIKSTAGIGSYNQSKDAPFDNFFIPNKYRGYRDSQGRFVEYSDDDVSEFELGEGIEKFFREKNPILNASLDELIKIAIEKYQKQAN